MKIINKDPDLMIIKRGNRIFYLVGILFVFVGLMAIFNSEFFAEQPSPWYGLIMIVLGCFTVLVVESATTSFNKTTDKVTFLQKSLVRQTTKEYKLSNIKEVELGVTFPTSTDETKDYKYHLALVFNDGESVPLDPGHSTTMRVGRKRIIPENSKGSKIASFLGVPFQERRPPTVGETLSAVVSAAQDRDNKREVDKQD